MRLSDTLLGLISLVAGVALGLYGWSLPNIPGQSYGPSAFPLMIAAGLLICAATLLVQGMRGRATAEAEAVSEPLWRSNLRGLIGIGLTSLLVIFYILAAKPLGFIPTATLIAFAMFLLMRVHPAKSALLAVITAFTCDFLFRTMLLVPLPFGIMPRLPW